MNRTIFRLRLVLTAFFLICSLSIRAEPAAVSSIAPDDLVDFSEQSPEVQSLIRAALSLTRKKLAYKFGSNSPSKGGMDCSGTVQYTLSEVGLTKLPRTSFDFYQWVKTSGEIHSTRKIYDRKDPAFVALKPGDLLFWEGTYSTGKRNPPISHVMIYLGTLKKDNQGVVYGASSGRRYRGKKIHGVSVFDFRIPAKESSSKFVGYGAIPGFLKNAEQSDGSQSKKAKTKKTVWERLGLKKKTSAIRVTLPKAPLAEPLTPSATSDELPASSEKPVSTE